MEDIGVQSPKENPTIKISFKDGNSITLSKEQVIELNLKLTKWLLEQIEL